MEPLILSSLRVSGHFDASARRNLSFYPPPSSFYTIPDNNDMGKISHIRSSLSVW